MVCINKISWVIVDLHDISGFCLANDLAREQRLNFGDDITGLLRVARKHKWLTAEEKCMHEEKELQSCLTKLIEDEKERYTHSNRALIFTN